jgi:predicted dehydrogenase
MDERMTTTRRAFLKTALTAGVAAGFPYVAPAQRDKTYRVALIGSGWWGTNILREAVGSGRCRVAALVDVDRRQLTRCAAEVATWNGDEPVRYEDYREMLERERPELVIVATPDHWHALPTIAALESGAHVYVEKPLAHTIREGRAMVRAARAADRVVQVGTHRRASPHNISAREFLRAGRAGEIGMVRCFVLYPGGREEPRATQDVPAELNWDLWCGPAPRRPYNGDGGIHPRGFRAYLDYANGQLGDWGIHWLDQMAWIMDEPWPTSVYSTGGRPIKGPALLTPEAQTTDAPDHQVAVYKFERFTATWEHRQFAGSSEQKGENVGCFFYGAEGVFHLGWQSGWTFYPSRRGEPEIHEPPTLHQPDAQNIRELWVDFLDAIETGRRPLCDVEAIHHSTNLSLLGMLSYKLGRGIAWDGASENVPNDAEANGLLRREYRAPWVYPAL